MKGMEDKFHETNREVVDLKKNVQELRVDLVAVQTELAVLKSGEATLHATGGTHLAKGQTHAHTPLDETGTSMGYGAQSYAATLQSSGPPLALVYTHVVQALTQPSQSHRKPEWYHITTSRPNNPLARLTVSLQVAV